MQNEHDSVRDRRALLKNAAVMAATLAMPGTVSAATRRLTQRDLRPLSEPPLPAPRPMVAARPMTSPRVVRPDLMRQALAALDTHGRRVARRDRIAIADMAAASSEARFHIVDLVSGRSQSFLVAHGSGSDPAHTGFLKRFSNEPNSNATSQGAFVTADYYVGKHGRSQRLIGLDPTNDNALARAIVVHSAWYANRDMLRTHGMLGRSQGCFAVGESDLARVFDQLGSGRMIFSAKV
ncbi:murein L,D-transpeptidase catalytic domain family protein [Sphingomonas sp. RP10(2022)]|uniref:Murein L,D-transpeptidase catalytic domain family protein n=1 Tax=Sphingomonas liriopis TaxID=2949094 RepID=A0A9X2HVT7_9SPHN|nr:murein L,D-transpeptidase catalytic domain family protein [Sphingomonas liriopis]MCP3735081.1 murein L,D-transpeptidase catalytic domain family protein [Sphingomonas liriopis]